jgi:hypothetical protein
MGYTISYFGDPPNERGLPHMEEVDVSGDLAEVTAQATRSVQFGAPYAWAAQYQIRDYDALKQGAIHDPTIVSWRRPDA